MVGVYIVEKSVESVNHRTTLELVRSFETLPGYRENLAR
jgi:hypothetical protein